MELVFFILLFFMLLFFPLLSISSFITLCSCSSYWPNKRNICPVNWRINILIVNIIRYMFSSLMVFLGLSLGNTMLQVLIRASYSLLILIFLRASSSTMYQGL